MCELFLLSFMLNSLFLGNGVSIAKAPSIPHCLFANSCQFRSVFPRGFPGEVSL